MALVSRPQLELPIGERAKVKHIAEWRCRRCGYGGQVPVLPGCTAADVNDAISRGHHRRDPKCADKYDRRCIQVEYNGKRWLGSIVLPLDDSSRVDRP